MKKIKEIVLRPIIENAIESGRIVGTSIVVMHRGKIALEEHAGWADQEQNISVNAETLFRLASMTKPIVSAAALVLLEKSLLKLDIPITHWLPAFTPKMPDGKVAQITLRHLLTHTAGLSYGFLSPDNEPYHSAGISDGMDEKVLMFEENLKRIASVPLLFVPGSAYHYSIATDIVGAILEKICGKPLPHIIEQYITEPLGMKDTSFYLREKSRLAKAYANHDTGNGKARLMQAADKVLLTGCGYIHYAPGRISNPRAYPSGGTGMVGTAKDYLLFLEAIRCGGNPILSSHSVQLLTQDLVQNFEVAAAGPGFGFGMGFAVVRDSELANTPCNKGSYEWGGVYGTKMFVDPQAELAVVILTNTALEGLLGKFPTDITRAIYSAIQ